MKNYFYQVQLARSLTATQGHERPRINKFKFLGVIFTPQNKRSDKRGQCDTTLTPP